jgi:trigger factor
VVKARYGQAVMSEVLEQSVSKATQQVVTDRGLRPALQPKIELVNFADGADLEFKVELELLAGDPMPDFAGIEVERLKAVPSEEQVNTTIETIAARNRKLEDVTEDRGAQKGEVAVCDFTGRWRARASPSRAAARPTCRSRWPAQASSPASPSSSRASRRARPGP